MAYLVAGSSVLPAVWSRQAQQPAADLAQCAQTQEEEEAPAPSRPIGFGLGHRARQRDQEGVGLQLRPGANARLVRIGR